MARAKAPADPVLDYARKVTTGKIVAGPYVRQACARHVADLKRKDLKWRREKAAHAIEFFRDMLVLESGEPFVLEPWQAFVVGSVFGWYGLDGFRRYRTAYVESGKGSGKALALDTPIPTPSGWTTMGELAAGDVVFDDAGVPTEVLETHAVMSGHPCFRVEFDDGESIVADADHLWATEQRRGGPGERIGIRTTGEIAATLRNPNGKYQSANHSILLASPLEPGEQRLPVSPYVLGAWLGDGDSAQAVMTIGEQDAAEMSALIAAEGESVRRNRNEDIRYRIGMARKDVCGRGHERAIEANGSHCRACERMHDRANRGGAAVMERRVQGLQERLRGLGVLGNKHIPLSYLRASADQRLALLQGLCDTDGHATKKGNVEVSSSKPALARGIYELLVSLGIKVAFPAPTPTRCNGKPATNPAYRFKFSPPAGMPVFRLKRKAARMVVTTKRRRLSQERRIVACGPVASVPVRCIRVASPSHLFLAGRGMIPTHNTPLAAGIGLIGLLADDERAPEVYAAATMRDQAKICFKDAVRMVEASPELAGLVSVQVGSLSIEDEHAVFRPVSSEHKGLDGLRVHVGLIDELHEHPTATVVDKVRAGTKNRRNAIIFEITNSGWDRTSVCWAHHELSVKVLEGTVENDAWFAYVCALDPEDDWKDEGCWLKANPSLGTVLPISYLRGQVTDAVGMPSKENIVKRLNFCIWTEQSERWLDMSLWDACGAKAISAEDLKGQPCMLALDAASTDDLAATVKLFGPDEDGYFRVLPRFWIPADSIAAKDSDRTEADRLVLRQWVDEGLITATPGNVIDYDYIEAEILKDAQAYQVTRLPFDRWNVTQLVTHLQDKLGADRVIDYPQDFHGMSTPSKELEKLVASGKLLHGGHKVLRWMASNVAAREGVNGQIKPDRERSRDKIDGIVALVMALGTATRTAPSKPSVYEERGLLAL